MKIAVIGSGISGLSAAYYLSKKYHVDLYEKEDHFGGHSHTVEIKNDKKSLAVDVGFIVFNDSFRLNNSLGVIFFVDIFETSRSRSLMELKTSIKSSLSF